MSVILYIVATPIGNLEDISLRALRILKEVDYILSEDTRRSAVLLKKYAIDTPLKSYRQHCKEKDITWALRKLESGFSLAFCSEAGTPGISDPAADLVRCVRQKSKAAIIPLPGPCAMSTALSVSGWQTNPCIFTGFLSTRRGKRLRALEDLRSFAGLIVIYESVHRIQSLLKEVSLLFSDRDFCLMRELSKVHEEHIFFFREEKDGWEQQAKNLKPKGEFTVLIAPLRGKEQG